MNDQNFEIINKIFRFAYIHTRFYFQHFVSSLLPLPQWSVHKTKLCKQFFGIGDVPPASRWYTILPSFLNSFTLQRCILQTLMDLQEIFSGKMSSDVWDPDMEETSHQILRCTFWFQFFCLEEIPNCHHKDEQYFTKVLSIKLIKGSCVYLGKSSHS